MYNVTVRKKSEAFLFVDCDSGIAQELSEFFTFFAEGYKFMPAYRNKFWDGKIRLFDIKTREIYCGLLPYIIEFCKAEGRNYNLEIDPKLTANDTIEDLNFSTYSKQKLITPHDYQIDSVKRVLGAKRGIIVSPTGSGKSLMIYLSLRWFLERSDKNVLVIVPTTSLVSQMNSDFIDYSYNDSSFSESDMHCIFSGKEKLNNQRVVISTWQSIYKMPEQWFRSFGMVIGDEAHGYKSKSLVSIMTKLKYCEYRIGTTGTIPDNAQVHKLVLEGLFGTVIQATTTKELMDQGTLAELKIKMLILKHPEDVRRNFKKNYQDEVDYIVRHEKRNNLIANLALDLEGNTLVLFNYVDKHGKPLFNLINTRAADNRKIFYVSGETKTDVREDIRHIVESEEDAIIVASLGTFSTGINIRNLHNIIFASPSKSQIRVLQSIGRGLRKSENGKPTQLYDFCDDITWKARKNYTFNHGSERIKIYSKEHFDYELYEIEI